MKIIGVLRCHSLDVEDVGKSNKANITRNGGDRGKSIRFYVLDIQRRIKSAH